VRSLVSIVIPAWNEGQTIGITLQALHKEKEKNNWWDELIVIDDGSIDDTYEQALPWADKVILHQHNKGKGAALQAGCREASHPILLLLDADLGVSAARAYKLLEPIISNQADMTIARFAAPIKKGGFGLVKGLAVHGIYWLSGYRTKAPLSGQRAIRKQILKNMNDLSQGFGIEVGLTIDVAKRGYRICEVDIPFQHRETGRNWRGFIHRGKQFISVGRTLLDKWLHPVC
jgi:glycosyltransferase involved in cell wall biosynthesis